MNKKIKLGYDDVSIVPEPISRIRHRKECFCYDDNLSLPIFTAPMDQVVDIDSAEIYMRNSINAVIPRTVDFENRIKLMLQSTDNERCFFAFSLTEAQELFLEIPTLNTPFLLIEQLRFNLVSELFTGAYRICIDIANGHMKELLDVIEEIKKLYGQRVIIMSGNIANPETYRNYAKAGCDFLRCSIGSGSRCVCAGTKIRMSNGELKNIEDVAIGDLVKTTDGDFEVINTFNKCVDKTILINNNIECTHDHKFLVVRKTDIPTTGIISDDKIKEISFYIEAEKLTDDYLLVSEENTSHFLNNIKLIEITSIEYKNSNQYVYDIEVKNKHQYCANGYFVHNCTTSSNVAVHFGCFSLLKEIWEIKKDMKATCKIIADGGIKGYGDIQKALLYADYVMIGGLFNKAIDSAGTPIYGRFYFDFFGKKILNPFKTFLYYGKKVKKKDYGRVLRLIKEGKVDVWKEYYGMSTKIAQSKINPNGVLKTGEGKVERQKVEYSIKQWVQNESDFLRSAMSYTNSKTLEEYKDSNWVQLVYKSYNA